MSLSEIMASVCMILVVIICLAELGAERGSRRALNLLRLRLLFVVGWMAAILPGNWREGSIDGWLQFHAVAHARLFLAAFVCILLVGCSTTLLKPIWSVFRTHLIMANGVVWLAFAVIVGATVDWGASAGAAYFFCGMMLFAYVVFMWQLVTVRKSRGADSAEYA